MQYKSKGLVKKRMAKKKKKSQNSLQLFNVLRGECTGKQDNTVGETTSSGLFSSAFSETEGL